MLGIKTWRYGLTCPLSEAIKRSVELGFGFVDINFHLIRYDGKIYYWPKEIAPNRRYEIKKMVKDYHLELGIVIPKTPQITHLGSIKIDDIAEPSNISEKEAQNLTFRLKQGIDVAKDIGAQLVDDIHVSTQADWRELEQIKSIMKSIDCEDIKIGIENRDDTDPKQLVKVIQDLKVDNLRMTFDVKHAYNYLKNCDTVAEQIRKLSASICHVHIHEKAEGSFPLFGFGEINWITIVKAFKSSRYQGSLTWETNPEDRHILHLPPHPHPQILRYKWIMEYLMKDA